MYFANSAEQGLAARHFDRLVLLVKPVVVL